jgi:two-component system response regulator MtrA
MSSKTERTKTVLVIDDEPLMLQLIKDILEPEGYNVISAVDGVAGMDLLIKTEPDIVLLDIMMPGPDGHQVLESIRQHSNVPVIMITAKRDTESLQWALNIGADDYLRKPFKPSELVARIHVKLRRTEIR